MKKSIIFIIIACAFVFSFCGSVSAADSPVADFSANVTNGMTPLSVQFTDTSTNNPVSWKWDFNNDGITDSNNQNPVYTYNTPGNYTVKLTVGNEAGNDTIGKLNYINVANPLPSNRHIFINVSNDEGVKYNLDGPYYGGPNDTYYIKADGGGLNQLHITTDVSNPNGQVTALTDTSGSPSGVFYITTTGGRGYNDDIILLISVKGPIPDDFSVHITSSGYNWTLTGAYPASYNYVANAVNQTFTKADFLYGPQTAKPGPGSLGVWSLPLYPGQNINDPSTAEYLMFIDLYAGNINSAPIDNGQTKIEYTFNHLNSFASFNAYAWCGASNQGGGISWTNNAASGYTVTYVPPVANFTAIPTNGKKPLTVQFNDTSTGNINSWAWDFDNDGTVDSTERNPTYTYNNNGIYTVKLTVTGPYDSDSEIKTDFITLTPVTNARTNKTYESIQAAIDDSETINGDTILVGSGPYIEIYTENVIVTKQLTIATRGNVTVTALDVNNPVFRITLGGTNSIINGFTVTGATNSSGIYIDPFVNATIVRNNIIGSLNGIYVGDGNVSITGNNIIDNSNNGVLIGNGNATITGNNITGNLNGIYIEDSDDTAVVRNNITENNITDNSNVGVYVGNGSPTIQYNRICNNGLYGLENTAKGENAANATYNWWGTNMPMYVGRTTAPGKTDIYDAHDTSHVTYNPWIVLTVNAAPVLLKTGATSNVIADLIHDNNGNVVSDGQIPDGAPVVFAYSLGSVTPVNTALSDNSASTTVTGGSSSGTANVTATVDGYTSGTSITIDTIAPIVNADVLGGTYNSTQTVILTTNDPQATIYYSINGPNPTTSSPVYTGPVTIDSTASLKYAAVDPAGNWSPVGIQNYLIGTTPFADSEWPKFMSDINNTGQSDYFGPQTNSTAWTYTTGNGIRYSSPAIGADGTIYIGSYDKYVYAINPDGTLKWRYLTGNYVYGSPAIGGDGTIYIGSSDRKFYALNPDGTLKWSYYVGSSFYGSPTIAADGTIYVGCYDRYLYAFNPDGTVRWSYNTGNLYYGSPAIGTDGTIYIGSYSNNNLYAINPDGTLKWTYTTGGRIYNSPAIGNDGIIYVGSYDTNVYAVNPDGTLKWKYLLSSSIYGSPAIGKDGIIYIGSNDGRLFALNPDGTQRWNYTTGTFSSIYSSPNIGADGTIYFGGYDKYVYAINPDGTLKWKYLTGNCIYSSPSIGKDGTLYIGSYDKKLYAFKDQAADLNTNVTVDNPTPNIGSNLNITFNVTNNGPGTAFRTVLTYTLPEWLNYISTNSDMGTVTYDDVSRMITWILGDFTVLDNATMSFLAQVIKSGTYSISPALTTITSDPNLAAHTGSADVTILGNVVNFRTGLIYNTIQDAIDDASTIDGDIINVGIGNYIENVAVNKQLILNAFGSVNVMALNVNDPVFSINNGNSVINGFTINGAINSYGIYIAPFVNSTIINNTISENGLDGIFIDGTDETTNVNLNTITGNIIKNNERDGIRVQSGSPIINSNEIYGNERDGIRIQAGNPIINSNNIYSNERDGIRVQSGGPIIHFNRIYNNGLYGLHDASTTSNITNASYNWWGTNTPSYVMSTIIPGKTDIYDAHTGPHVIYNPWIVLTADAIPDLLKVGASSTVTAYLTHDSNGDAITGQVPDGIPVNFNFSSGTINPENTTTNGSATTTLTAGNISCTTNATVTVDACTINVPITIDTVVPTVTNNVPGGTYNTTQNITLTADEPGTIYYTSDGTNPTTSSSVFTDPIAINSTTTLRYAAVDLAGNWSPIYIINYVIGPGGLADSPQPEFQNNNNHTGQSDYPGPQTNTTYWNYNTGSGMYGYGSPTIGTDGTLFVGNIAGVLFAINPDGTQKWNYTSGSGSIQCAPAIGADGTIYFISGKIIYALNPDGTQKWNYTMGSGTYASPAISVDGTIYIGSSDKNLYAINPDGTLKWTYLTDPGTYGSGFSYSTPAIGADGTIYIGSENGRFYAFNPDGTLKWKYRVTDGNIRSSPSIGADGTIYFTNDNLYAMNPDGTLKWIYDEPLDSRTSTSWSTPAIETDGTIYFAQSYSVGALNSDGTLKWAYYTDCCMYYTSAAIGANRIIYFGSYNMYAMNPDGTLKWQYNNANTYSAAIGADGTLYFGSSDGNLYAIKDLMPVANFTAGATNGIAPLTVQFTDQSTGSGPLSYAWDFNSDGITDSTEQNPTWVYSTEGTYTVTLTVTNVAGNDTQIKTDYISVYLAPVANFTANATNGIAPLTVQFTDQSTGSGPLSYAWDFNSDGITDSTEQNPVYTYNNAGTFTVRLSVTGPGGSNEKIKTDHISIYLTPVANFTANATNGIAPLTVQFTDQSTGSGPLTYAWDFNNDGIIDSTEQNPTWTYITPGVYTVVLTAINNWGSKSLIKTDYVTVNWPIPVADFSTNVINGTVPHIVQFTDTSTYSTSWSWDFNNDGITDSTLQNPTWTYSSPGVYSVKLTASNPAGNDTVIKTDHITVLKSDVFVQVTPSKNNPQVGDKVTYTFKLGNNGPGDAKDVVFTYVIPEGVEFAGAVVDQGNWTYDPVTRTLTWYIGDVAANTDPYLWLDLNILRAGSFSINPVVTVSGNSGLAGNIGSLLVNAVSASTSTVNAQTNTIPMQNTGIPVTGLLMGLLLIGSGLAIWRKK